MSDLLDSDWWRRVFRGTATALATILSIAWLLVLVVVIAGFVVGPAPVGEGPTIDPADPPATIAGDALESLEYRDHTEELWLYRRNATSGDVAGGIAYRVTVEHSAGEVRVRNYPGALSRGEWTNRSADSYRFFGTRVVRYQRLGEAGRWRRISQAGVTYDREGSGLSASATVVRRANATLAAENATHLVVTVREQAVVNRLASFSPARNATQDRVRIVVRKGTDPHLAAVVYEGRTHEGTYRERHVVTNVGTADARRPRDGPGTGASDPIARTLLGAERIVDWIGDPVA